LFLSDAEILWLELSDGLAAFNINSQQFVIKLFHQI
jgi:hypothetical protein